MIHRRSKAFSRGFRKKPLVKWHTTLLTWNPAGAPLVVNTNNVFELINTSERGATQALSVLPDNAVECRVNAIRGQLIFENDGNNYHNITWGIRVIDLVNNAVPAVVPNPTLLPDAAGPWAWLEAQVCVPTAHANGQSLIRVEVNVRSKRVLKPGQTMILCIDDTQISGTPSSDMYCYIQLRTLVTRLD